MEIDSQGRERRVDEVVVIGRGADIEAVRARGYTLLTRAGLEGSADVVARVRVRDGRTIEDVISDLHGAIPSLQVSPNYLFRVSAGAAVAPARGAATSTAAVSTGGPAQASAGLRPRVGLLDTGVDADHPSLRGLVGLTRGFAGPYTPREHGTGVAQVAARAGAAVAVADVFAVDASGAPAASVDALARALDWFIAQHVEVVNISITGPENAILADMVARARRAGLVIVAAAGNEGPGAAPAFPAAMDGVVAVTAVDTAGHIYRRANRGSYIDFAALGVQVPVTDSAGVTHAVSGTSFAAPRVAAILARLLAESPARHGDDAVRQLAHEAVDLGAPGRDPVFGWGGVRSN